MDSLCSMRLGFLAESFMVFFANMVFKLKWLWTPFPGFLDATARFLMT